MVEFTDDSLLFVADGLAKLWVAALIDNVYLVWTDIIVVDDFLFGKMADGNAAVSIAASPFDLTVLNPAVYGLVSCRKTKEKKIVNGHDGFYTIGFADVEWQFVRQSMKQLDSVFSQTSGNPVCAPQGLEQSCRTLGTYNRYLLGLWQALQQLSAAGVGYVEFQRVFRGETCQQADNKTAIVAEACGILCRPFGIKSDIHNYLI